MWLFQLEAIQLNDMVNPYTAPAPQRRDDEEELSVTIQAELPDEAPTLDPAKALEPLGTTGAIIEGVRALPDVGLTIGSSVIGFFAGAANASLGLAKNVLDLSTLGQVAGEPYDKDAAMMLFKDIPDDLVDDFNKGADLVSYVPENETAARWVTNLGNAVDGVRRWTGDRFAGIETDTLEEEIESTREVGPGRAIAGAVGQTLTDLAIMGAVGFAVKAVKGSRAPKLGKAPIKDVGAQTINLKALDALENSKPHFKSPAEAKARMAELAGGKIRAQIVVETDKGLPVRVIAGQDAILAYKEATKRGLNVQNVKVKTIEKAQTGPINTEAVARFNKALEADEAALARLQSTSGEILKRKAVQQFVDVSGNVISKLLKANPELGRLAVR